MHAARGAGRSRVTLLAVLAAVVLATTAVFAAAANTKPGITVQVSPASQTVQRGQSVSYTVTLTSTGGFAGTAALSASKLPKGATATFVQPGALNSGSTSAGTVTISTSSSTTLGASTFDITATSGKTSGSVSAGLSVATATGASLALSASPASMTMESGATGVYTVQLSRSDFTGDVDLGVQDGLPAGATALFSPSPATGNSSTLQVTVPDDTPDGTYNLKLTASGPGGSPVASTVVKLVIDTSNRPFAISGDLALPLYPGASRPLELTLRNTAQKRIGVTHLSVTLQVSDAPNATSSKPCSAEDYRVTQYSGPYPLPLGKLETKTLTQLGVPQSQWPQVAMLNTALDQDGCKGATLTLTYTGTGQGD